jgi:hypothetical protein
MQVKTYTVLDDTAPRTLDNAIAIAILPRGNNPFFSHLVEELARIGSQEMILFNTRYNQVPYHKHLRHIWVPPTISTGEMVNIAITESHSQYVFIVYSDQHFIASDVSSHVFLRIEERNDLCTIPQLFAHDGSKLPMFSAPAFDHQGFRVIRRLYDGQRDVRIFSALDYAGIYHRNRFMQLGGYDTSITNSYWQKNDFAFRAAMWGERIVLNPALNLHYTEKMPIDDESFDISSRIFALKSLAVKLGRNGAYIPLSRFMWLIHSKHPWHTFQQIRQWIWENRFHFQQNAGAVVDQWNEF